MTEMPCKTLSKSLVRCDQEPLPSGCPEALSNLSRFRAIVAATAVMNSNPIPDGMIYECTYTILNRDALPTVLRNDALVAATVGGAKLPVEGASGRILASEE
jgi:hypothetical protein